MPEVSKVILDGVTIMDVTQDTINSTNTLTGFTGHKNDGVSFTGSYTPMGMTITDVVEQDGGTIRTITGTEISGTKQITENGTYDVSQYASADVSVSGGATFPDTLKINVFNDGTDATSVQIQYVIIDNGYVRTATENIMVNGTETISVPSGKNEIRLSAVSTSSSNMYSLNLSVVVGDGTATISMLSNKDGILTYTPTSSNDEINVTIGYSTGYFNTVTITNNTSALITVPNYRYDSASGKVLLSGTALTTSAGTKAYSFPVASGTNYCLLNIRTSATKPAVTITSDYAELIGSITYGNYIHNLCLIPKAGTASADLPDTIPITVSEVTE